MSPRVPAHATKLAADLEEQCKRKKGMDGQMCKEAEAKFSHMFDVSHRRLTLNDAPGVLAHAHALRAHQNLVAAANDRQGEDCLHAK